MKGFKMPAALKNVAEFGKQNAPTIMSIAAVVGVIGTVVAVWKVRPKAEEVIQKANEELEKIKAEEEERTAELDEQEQDGEDVTEKREELKKDVKSRKRSVRIEQALCLGKYIWPVGVCVGVTCGLIICANRISVRRIAMITGAYEIATGDLKKYREKAKEIVGEKKEEEVRKEVAKAECAPFCDKDGHPLVVYSNGTGDQLYWDWWSGMFFRSSDAHVVDVFANAYDESHITMFTPLNDIYRELGMPEVGCGEDWGVFGKYVKPNLETTWFETPGGDRAVELRYDIDVRHDVHPKRD